jgi:hypothetical protein
MNKIKQYIIIKIIPTVNIGYIISFEYILSSTN